MAGHSEDTPSPTPSGAEETGTGSPTAPSSAGGGDPVSRARDRIADGVEHPVERSWVTVRRIGGAIGVAAIGVPLVAGGATVAATVEALPAWARLAVLAGPASIVAVLILGATVLPAAQYRRLRYRLDPEGLAIRQGVWWRRETRVSRSRVQHTDVTQGPVERAFGLATLVVFTAGTEHAKVSLQGLREDRARAIRDALVDEGGEDGV